ncbi:MAG TPA: DNA polymerase IV [Clostridia bacterium]|nr:DNA polymerase IV [Clostridia bacterium]
MEKIILLADMNSFFASVHQALNPSLRNKPVVVGGNPSTRHGVVLAASYEAKAYGIKAGITVGEANVLCPHAIFLKPVYSFYVNFSTRILNIMRDFTPLVEPFSVDEAFMDITGSQKIFGNPVEIARKLKERIKTEIGVLCSVGIGPNKLLAKMAADMQKPDGLTVLHRKDISDKLWPLPVRKLFGVGPRYEHHLSLLGIKTIGDLASFPPDILKKRFGITGQVLWLCANGIDCGHVDPHSLDRVKSIGHQITLPRDYRTREDIKVVISELAEMVGYRVRAGKYLGKTVVLSLKDHNFRWLSRMKTLHEYTDLAEDIYDGIMGLLDEHWVPFTPIRMVGVTLANLNADRPFQASFFSEKERLRKLSRACDHIRGRFGEDAIKRAASLTSAGVLHAQ